MSQKENNIFQLARIIAASLRGKANDEEQRTLREWLSVSTRNKKIYDGFKDGKRLEQKIVESRQINWEKDYQQFITKRQRTRKNRRIKTIIRYAAILTLPLVAAGIFLLQKNDRQAIVSISEVIKPGEHKAVLITGGGERITLSDSTLSPIQEQNGMIVNVMNNKVFYTLPEDSLCTQESPIFNTLQIPRGGEYFLTLADGTEVWLNAETEIRYPVQFTGDKRVVYLDGEAYFTVAPDKKKPFTVVSHSCQRVRAGNTIQLPSLSRRAGRADHSRFRFRDHAIGKIQTTDQAGPRRTRRSGKEVRQSHETGSEHVPLHGMERRAFRFP